MSDFPSIEELTAHKKPSPNASALGGSSHTTAEKFNKKIEEINLGEKEREVAQKAASIGLPHINLDRFPVTAEALRIIPEETARANKLVCFFFTPEEVRIGTTVMNANIETLARDLGERYHAHVAIYLISEHSLEHVLTLYATLPIVKPINKDINITDEELAKFNSDITNLQSIEAKFRLVPITDVITLMIAAALKVDASDVHIEAEEKGVAVRYRIDGVLHDVAELPKEQWKKFVSRIKLLAMLKINITDRPQDGRVTLALGSGNLDVRVSTMPTVHGESVVMRILHSGHDSVSFDNLGLRGDAYNRLKREIERPNGMIITTGPTGSGKTTTMYSVLRTLNKSGVKIITVEDPVEIKVEGVNQSQIDASKGYTFAKALRSILRQDPDICMVGEIRDLETAEISIQAALTGHLMLSTIHTNSASGAIPRFLSMGVKPFLLAPALNSVIGQRLVRRICPSCIELTTLTPEMTERIRATLANLPEAEKKNINFADLQFYHGTGCTNCSGLGYKGRIGIYEIFTMNKDLEQAILSNEISEYTIQELAIKGGMVTMAQDGILKALDKITTPEEVFRVTE